MFKTLLATAIAVILTTGYAEARHHRHSSHHKTPAAATEKPVDGNGVIVSRKTGARARVGASHAAAFQAYIDDLESRGARVLFMGGIRRGHCSPSSEHPCGKALDVCQLRRGVVDSRCNLPSRRLMGDIAAAHGLFEGGRWCNSDYGHAQVGVTAAACGERMLARIKQQPAAEASYAYAARSKTRHVRLASHQATFIPAVYRFGAGQ